MGTEKGRSTVIAALIGASVTILAIGALNFAGEASEGFKDFMTFWNGMGSLSGKVTLAYALGLLVFFALFRIKSVGRQSLVAWTVVLYSSIAVSSLLLYTPFVHWLV